MFRELALIVVSIIVTRRICIKNSGVLGLYKGPAKMPRPHRIITTV